MARGSQASPALVGYCKALCCISWNLSHNLANCAHWQSWKNTRMRGSGAVPLLLVGDGAAAAAAQLAQGALPPGGSLCCSRASMTSWPRPRARPRARTRSAKACKAGWRCPLDFLPFDQSRQASRSELLLTCSDCRQQCPASVLCCCRSIV